MYCTTCDCEYIGWRGRCPTCGSFLLGEKPAVVAVSDRKLKYDELIQWIVDLGGQVIIPLATSEVGTARRTRFPWRGYGFAWEKRMQGALDDIFVDLKVSAVGMEQRWSFPYFGYGYAWAKNIEGEIAGNSCSLEATNVIWKRAQRFPWRGYGYAWVQDMEGSCGERIRLELHATRVERVSRWAFPYFGFGYAWTSKADLVLIPKES